jgi:putative membrane protein
VIALAHLPTVNAVLNGCSALLLSAGYLAIRRRRVSLHRLCMLAAFGTSALFLVSYLTYHAAVGATRFTRTGPVRLAYFTILTSHTIMAAVALPLAVATLLLALRGSVTRHRALARWTLPVWLYVSVTGVAIYWMLYRL